MKELRYNGIHINEEMFKSKMRKIIEENGEVHEELMNRLTADEENLTNIFHSMNVHSDGRILSFLTLLYYQRQRGVNISASIRLVANVMKMKTLKKVEKSMLQKLTPYIGLVLVNLLTHEFIKTH